MAGSNDDTMIRGLVQGNISPDQLSLGQTADLCWTVVEELRVLALLP